MKIAFFSDNFYPEISGIADSVIQSGKELARRGHIVRYYAPAYSKKDFAVAKREYRELDLGENVSFKRVFSFPFPNSPTKQSRIVCPTGSQILSIRAFKPDIIHSHCPFGVGIEALIAARVLGIPLLGTNHTSILDFIRYMPIRGRLVNKIAIGFLVWYYNRCKFVTTPSPSALDEMTKNGLKKPSCVVSNPIDSQLFHPVLSLIEKEELKKKFNLTKRVIVCAGRLAPEKNVALLIDALALVVKKTPNVVLAIAGHGIERNNLEKQVKELHLEDNVVFVGTLSMETLSDLYRSGDLFVIPSSSEVQSMTMLQALSSGLPVIAAQSKGTEYLKETFGFVLKSNTPEELSEKINKVLADEHLRISMGKAAHEYSLQFSLKTMADAWGDLYNKVIAHKY